MGQQSWLTSEWTRVESMVSNNKLQNCLYIKDVLLERSNQFSIWGNSFLWLKPFDRLETTRDFVATSWLNKITTSCPSHLHPNQSEVLHLQYSETQSFSFMSLSATVKSLLPRLISGFVTVWYFLEYDYILAWLPLFAHQPTLSLFLSSIFHLFLQIKRNVKWFKQTRQHLSKGCPFLPFI